MVKSNKVADKNLEIQTIPEENQANSTKNATRNNLTKKKIALLAITIGMGKLGFFQLFSCLFTLFSIVAYVGWGLLLSLQPSFYPSEAEKKGATASQYGLVFGMPNLAAFLTAPIFGKFGTNIGPKWLFNFGAFTQGFVGLTFGFLIYLETLGPFLGLSYFLR